MNEQGRFATTRWTVVLQAAREDPGGQRPALAELYQQYQQPLYVVARVRGLSHEDTVDALHDFFCELLDGNMLAAADQQRGRFRAFLLTAWRRFLTDIYRRGAALKRGGEHQRVSIHVVADASFDQRLVAIGDSVAEQEPVLIANGLKACCGGLDNYWWLVISSEVARRWLKHCCRC